MNRASIRFLACAVAALLCSYTLVALPAEASVIIQTTSKHSAGSVMVSEKRVMAPDGMESGDVAIYTLTYTLTAFGADVSVPRTLLRMTDTASAEAIGFIIEDRNRQEVSNGIALGVVIPEDAERGTGPYLIPEGETAKFTLLVVFVDPTNADYEGRLRITNYPMTIGDNAPIFLSSGELSDLNTKFAEFY